MGCTDKVKQTCGSKIYAPCVEFEKEVPSFSTLTGCLTIEETTEDLYKHVGDIKEEIDLSDLGQECLQYVGVGQIPKVKDILLKYEEEICILKEEIDILKNTAICDKNITECDLDLSGIVGICDNPITTLGELLNYFITHINP